MRFAPEPEGNDDRIDTDFAPPDGFDAGPVQLPVMSATERDRKLVADLEPETPWLRKTQMVGIGGLRSANWAGLLADESQMSFVAQPTWLRENEQAFCPWGPTRSPGAVATQSGRVPDDTPAMGWTATAAKA